MKVAQVSGLKEKVKVPERQNEISMICFTIFLNTMARHSFALYICMYVILVYAKLIYLLSFVLIIIYCDSVSVNQD